MTTKTVTRAGIVLCKIAAVSICALMMIGCPTRLPKVTATFPVAEGQTLSATLVPLPLLGIPLVPGITCNLPDEEDLEQAVRDSLGPSLSSVITIESAEVLTIILEVAEDSPADFGSLTGLELTLYLLDTEGLRVDTIPLGTAEAPDGFGSTIELEVDPPADIVALVQSGGDCGTVAITATGFTPDDDVVFDVSARVRIQAALG